MRRDQLEHAIRTACQIIGRPEVIVVGSQSILGSFSEDELPADATMSVEIDILPIADGSLRDQCRFPGPGRGVEGERPRRLDRAIGVRDQACGGTGASADRGRGLEQAA
jgi:hypothetical protein